MIRLTCTQCKSVLEMDDAFAGGVCRCQHCGTIQTVPSHLKGSAGSAVSAGTGAKSLYQGAGNTAGTGTRGNGTGLYDLADAVGSSGLSRGNIKDRPIGTANVPAQSSQAALPPNRWRLLLVAAGVIIVILLGLVLWLLLGQGKSPDAGSTPPPPSVNPDVPPQVVPVTPAAPAGPHFLTVPIDSNRVVYLIDRSDSAKQTFDMVKAGMVKSIESLDPHAEFAVVFWGRPGETDLAQWSFPEQGMSHATPQQAELCQAKFSDIQAIGATDISAAVKQAFALNPEIVLLVTAKGISLDDDFARAVDSARKDSSAKIYTIDLANGEGRKFLEPIATSTHGTYTPLSPFDVKPD